MKRRIFRISALALVLALLLSGCVQRAPDDGKLHVLCTTYPMYLLTTAVTGEAEDVRVDLLVNAQTACLHDYTLTVDNMKAIEAADVIVMSGAGLEDFMADALAQSDAALIDVSQGVGLLPALERHHHEGAADHDEERDPHYWMDPRCFVSGLMTVAAQLTELDAAHKNLYADNLTQAIDDMSGSFFEDDPLQTVVLRATGQGRPLTELCSSTDLITFHDGFQYFADAFGLNLLSAIEEEEGSTVSAQEIKEIVALIEEHHIPAIFVEKNGSRTTADVIARETGCKVYELDLMMSGDGAGVQAYLDAMGANLNTILEALT